MSLKKSTSMHQSLFSSGNNVPTKQAMDEVTITKPYPRTLRIIEMNESFLAVTSILQFGQKIYGQFETIDF